MAARASYPPPVPESIYGWTLRHGGSAPCAGCGSEARAAYQLRRLTPRGWVEVQGQRWCLRCWSGTSTRSRVTDAAGGSETT